MQILRLPVFIPFIILLYWSSSFSVENKIIITEKIGVSTTNYPLQIGCPFVKGEIPSFPEALLNGSPVTTQADVKTRYPDGSVKHAVISLLIPELAANGVVTLTFRNQTTGNNTGYLTRPEMLASEFNFDATMDLDFDTIKSVSARTVLNDSSYHYWLKGSVATSIILADHSLLRKYDLGSDANKSLRPIFHATFWPGINKVFVRFIGENANTEFYQDQLCSITLKAGQTSPVTVFTQSAVTITAGSRWTKTAWIGSEPTKVDIKFNLAYLSATCALPNYDTTKVVPDAIAASNYSVWLSNSKNFYSSGFWAMYMGMTGGRPDIGPYPSWVV